MCPRTVGKLCVISGTGGQKKDLNLVTCVHHGGRNSSPPARFHIGVGAGEGLRKASAKLGLMENILPRLGLS